MERWIGDARKGMDTRPGERSIEFRPNPVYLYERPRFDVEAAAKAMLTCLAGWATQYEFWPVGHPEHSRRGLVPPDHVARDALVEASWRWLHEWWTVQPDYDGLTMTGVYLERDGGLLLDQHDGFSDSTRVFVSASEFVRLRDCMTGQGLPADFLRRARNTEAHPP